MPRQVSLAFLSPSPPGSCSVPQFLVVCGDHIIRSNIIERHAKFSGWLWLQFPMKSKFQEPFCEINYGPLLKDVLRARGWRYSTEPCHGVYDKESDKSTFYIKEFEATWNTWLINLVWFLFNSFVGSQMHKKQWGFSCVSLFLPVRKKQFYANFCLAIRCN